jgi:hypothetical protein
MKSILVFSAKLIASILFTLALIEAGLRLFPRSIPLDLLIHFDEQPRREIALKLGLKTRGETVFIERDDGGPDLTIFKPFTTVVWPVEENGTVSRVVMDQNGFCNPPEIDFHRPQVDIITLGDSFTWCNAVDPQDTWASKLSAITGLSVYNLGQPGIGAYEYIQIFKKFGIQKSPRIVIMNVYEGNDLRDVARYYDYRRYHEPTGENTQPTPMSSRSVAISDVILDKKLLEEHSYTYNLANSLFEYWQASDPPSPSSPDTSGEVRKRKINFKYSFVFAEETIPFNPENVDIDEVDYAERLFNQELQFEVFGALREPIESFVELSQQYGFVPIVTYTPSAYTAYAANVVFEEPALKEIMPWFSHQQRDYLKEQAAALGYTFVDLTPALQDAARAHGPQELLYYRYDLHLTSAGHTVIAEAISQALQDMDLIEGR